MKKNTNIYSLFMWHAAPIPHVIPLFITSLYISFFLLNKKLNN